MRPSVVPSQATPVTTLRPDRARAMPRLAMSRLAVLALALLIWLALVMAWTASVWAQTTDPTIRTLLEKAQFWYEHGNQTVALNSFDRVLAVDPANSDALIGASKVALDMGREDLVQSYAARLRKVAPEDPWLAELDTAKRRTPQESAILQEARHLTVLGRREDALADYRKLMPDGKVPDELAGEYYPLLISTLPQDSVDADNALTALRNLAQARPRDLSLQLALAQGMIVSEGSRTGGIDMLRDLAHNPLLSHRVRPIWRQALLWQGVDIKAADQIEEYLKENPSDPEMDAKVAEMRASLPSKSLRARMLGYEAITSGDLKSAEADFREAFEDDKTDADAAIMMAVVRLKQGRAAEAKPFIAQAIALAPERRQEFLGMVGEDPVANAKAAADAARAVAAQYKEVAALADAGRYDAAIQLLRKLMDGKRDAGLTLQLAGLQARAGQQDAALASLRGAVAIDPGNGDALLALASALTARGQTVEAQGLFASAETEFRRTGNEKALREVHRAQAEQMRADALKLSDQAAREQALRAALAVDPSNWWIRLEIARVMQRTGRGSDAAAMMAQAEHAASAPGALDTQAGQDALQVAVTWALEHSDEGKAVALARLVPAGSRSVALRNLLAQGTLHDQVEGILASPDYAARLVAMARQPDPDGARGDVIGHALLRRQDIPSLRAALAAALVATPRPTPAQRLRYAGLLLEANQIGGARSVLEGIDQASLSAEQRAALGEMRGKLAVSQAELLVRANRPREAEALLRPLLTRRPDIAPLQVAMARVQTALGHASDSLPVLLAAVQRDPADLAARFGAIDAAMATGRLGLADDLAQEGIRRHPRDPFMLVQAANVARARGLNGQALDDLERARALRAATLDTSAESEPTE